MRPLADPTALPERAFMNQVVSLARMYGWRVYHAPAGGKEGRADREQVGVGWPDLSMVHENDVRLLFAELKREKGRATAAQLEWLAALAVLGGPVEAYLWRPSQWDEINETLRPRSWS